MRVPTLPTLPIIWHKPLFWLAFGVAGWQLGTRWAAALVFGTFCAHLLPPLFIEAYTKLGLDDGARELKRL